MFHPVAKMGGWYERAKREGKKLALRKKDLGNWVIGSRKGDQYVPAEKLVGKFTIEQLTSILGNLPLDKYKKLCEATGVDLDLEVLQRGGDSIFLRQSMIRKKKTEENA